MVNASYIKQSTKNVPKSSRKVQFNVIFQPLTSIGDKHLQKVVVWEIKLPREKGILEDFMWWLFLYTSAFLCIEIDEKNKHEITTAKSILWWSIHELVDGDGKWKRIKEIFWRLYYEPWNLRIEKMEARRGKRWSKVLNFIGKRASGMGLWQHCGSALISKSGLSSSWSVQFKLTSARNLNSKRKWIGELLKSPEFHQSYYIPF